MKPKPGAFRRLSARSAIAAAAALLGAALAFQAGCVSSGQFKSLEQERDALATWHLFGELHRRIREVLFRHFGVDA